MAEKKKLSVTPTTPDGKVLVALIPPDGADAVSFGDKVWKAADGVIKVAEEDVPHLLTHGGCKLPGAPEPAPESVNGPPALLAEDEENPS